MTEYPLTRLQTDLQAFNKFDSAAPGQAINNAHSRILTTVQALMLQGNNPEGYVKA